MVHQLVESLEQVRSRGFLELWRGLEVEVPRAGPHAGILELSKISISH